MGVKITGLNANDKLKQKLRVMFRAGMVIVVSSFLYDLSFTIFGVAQGDSFFDSFKSQFSLGAWKRFWFDPIGAAISLVYLVILFFGFLSIYRPSIWMRNQARRF